MCRCLLAIAIVLMAKWSFAADEIAPAASEPVLLPPVTSAPFAPTTVAVPAATSQSLSTQPSAVIQAAATMPQPAVSPATSVQPVATVATGQPLTVIPPSSPVVQQASAECAVPVFDAPASRGEAPWCKSPYADSAWRIAFDLIPTTSHVSEQSFGAWDKSAGLALRLGLGYEGDDGFGTRLQVWGFGAEAETRDGDIELDASTFYWDFYKRFFVQDAEIMLGGGAAGSYLNFDVKDFDARAHLNSGGITMFAEGFYPLWKLDRTDIGTIGRGRIALLSGEWRDHDSPFVNDVGHDTMQITELGWGIEIRRRFGRMQDKYCYFDFIPEFQRWESSSLPDIVDPGFEGTNISFGLAW